jgi:hypothetical protein
MSRVKGNLVRVKDKKGDIFEVSPANAHDLVQHLGWTYMKVITEDEQEAVVEDEVKTQLAHSPRALRTREDEIAERVAKERAHRKPKEDKEPKAKRTQRKKPAAEDEGTSGDPELDALEREEAQRSDPAYGLDVDGLDD